MSQVPNWGPLARADRTLPPWARVEGLSEILRGHLLEPRGAGAFVASEPGAVATGRAENPPCGDELLLHLRLRPDGLLEARFQAKACSGVLAVASLVCGALAGRSQAEAGALDLARLVADAGGLPPTRQHALGVVTRALERALAQL
ncbi:MAG: hypothetical protein GC161_10165 [Planctomycetaceae bacterium]|nr:hypothetical protein [Planctomycetaceae bacterium]